MQRYKEYMQAKLDRYGRSRAGVSHYTAGKFVYGANGTLCQYARWRQATFNLLEHAALYRDSASRYPYFTCDARAALRRARNNRNVANLVFARLEVRHDLLHTRAPKEMRYGRRHF